MRCEASLNEDGAAVTGATAARHGPLSITSHHLSTIKRCIGGCLSIVLLRKIRDEVLKKREKSARGRSAMRFQPKSPRLHGEQAALGFKTFKVVIAQRSRWENPFKLRVRCIADSARLAERCQQFLQAKHEVNFTTHKRLLSD
jgi:hypothetical protein